MSVKNGVTKEKATEAEIRRGKGKSERVTIQSIYYTTVVQWVHSFNLTQVSENEDSATHALDDSHFS